uniref:Cilia and flagella associated protein 54 n=1 Tax=Pygocentrus nattereri TaxID=42514 RepID=A0A3B4D9J8_PYGNA
KTNKKMTSLIWLCGDSSEMDPLPASYYGKLDKSNPVISSFEKDLKDNIFGLLTYSELNFVLGLTVMSMKLFDIWKKYEPRLPTPYFHERLLQIADFLFASKFHALQGECLCTFHLERERSKRPDPSGLQKLLEILTFLRIMMQAILPHESLCWLLYNGSLHIYNICRFLMSVSHAALEYLLWACVCLETSVPLLMPRFLPWRATLYCAVCECYYDGQAAVQAEVFARRALGKVSELGKLEELSGSPSSAETQRAFKEATIKLAVMVFKRSVYEPRKKPKGLFRPKQKSSLKEGHNIPWPRTLTEQILMELFEGNAAQFLAVLEGLWDSSCRPLHTGMSDEPEIQEVALELISAGISILSGIPLHPSMFFWKNQIPVESAVKFVKLLFRYEQWDAFRSLTDNLMAVLMTDSTCMPICFYMQDIQVDGDMVLDIVLFLWAKCKVVFQRAQARHYDQVHYLGKTENQDKVIIT